MMALNASYNGYVGIAKQSAKGTAVAPSTFVRFLSAVKADPELDISVFPEGGGGFTDITAQKQFHKHDGGFELYARPSVAAKLFAFALGADTVVGTAAPYTHTIIPARPLPYLTIERGMKTNLITDRIQDCMINGLKLEGEAGKPLKLSLDFLGIQAALQGTGASDTYETDSFFTFMSGAFTLLGTGAFTRITKFGLGLSNNVDGGIQTVEVHREALQALLLGLTLDFEVVYDSADTNYADIFYGGGTSVVDTVKTGAVTLDFTYGAGAALRELKVEIPLLNYKAIGTPAPAATPATLRQAVAGVATKGAGELITVTSKNADAAAYI